MSFATDSAHITSVRSSTTFMVAAVAALLTVVTPGCKGGGTIGAAAQTSTPLNSGGSQGGSGGSLGSNGLINGCDPLKSSMGGGSGTSTQPYLICSVSHLKSINSLITDSHGNPVPGLYFKLASDLSLSGVNDFVPLGDTTTAFIGQFDGNGRTLSNLGLDLSPRGDVGLFSRLGPGAVVKNLNLHDFNMIGDSAVGALAGQASGATISNCHTTGTRADSAQVRAMGGSAGGLVGFLDSRSQIIRSSSGGLVSGITSVGGLVGEMSTITFISESSSTATVSSTTMDSRNGGIVGFATGQNSVIANSFFAGSLTGSAPGGYVAGIFGKDLTTQNVIVNSYATGAWNVSGAVITGLTGYSGGTFALKSFWDTEVTGALDLADGSSRTTADMKNPTTYAGWDSSFTWGLSAGQYPTLRWQSAITPVCDDGISNNFGGGNGSSTAPYLICSMAQLDYFASWLSTHSSSGKYFRLTTDLFSTGPSTIYTNLNFAGNFDGAGHLIYFAPPDLGPFASSGFFGALSNAIITNLVLMAGNDSLYQNQTNSTITDVYYATSGQLPQLVGPYVGCNSAIINNFGGGDGSPSNPYLICSRNQLDYFASFVLNNSTSGSYFRLTTDIPLEGQIFTISGVFSGDFDGAGNSLTNIGNGNYSESGGLFSSLSNASVRNLSLINSSWGNDTLLAGGLIANVATNSTIHNCHVIQASIDLPWKPAGGLIGSASGNINITDSSFQGYISGAPSGYLIGEYVGNGGSLNLSGSTALNNASSPSPVDASLFVGLQH